MSCKFKNGKMRTINSRSAAITFVSYFVYTSLLREVFGDSFLGDNDEEIERFIDIFTKGILKVEETEKQVSKWNQLLRSKILLKFFIHEGGK